jgi:hypothetical protein
MFKNQKALHRIGARMPKRIYPSQCERVAKNAVIIQVPIFGQHAVHHPERSIETGKLVDLVWEILHWTSFCSPIVAVFQLGKVRSRRLTRVARFVPYRPLSGRINKGIPRVCPHLIADCPAHCRMTSERRSLNPPLLKPMDSRLMPRSRARADGAQSPWPHSAVGLPYARTSRSGPVPASNFAAILTGLGGVEVEEFDDVGRMAGGEAFLLFGFFG